MPDNGFRDGVHASPAVSPVGQRVRAGSIVTRMRNSSVSSSTSSFVGSGRGIRQNMVGASPAKPKGSSLAKEVQLCLNELDDARDVITDLAERAHQAVAEGGPVRARARTISSSSAGAYPEALDGNEIRNAPTPWRGWAQFGGTASAWEVVHSPANASQQSPEFRSPQRKPGKTFDINCRHFSNYSTVFDKATYASQADFKEEAEKQRLREEEKDSYLAGVGAGSLAGASMQYSAGGTTSSFQCEIPRFGPKEKLPTSIELGPGAYFKPTTMSERVGSKATLSAFKNTGRDLPVRPIPYALLEVKPRPPSPKRTDCRQSSRKSPTAQAKLTPLSRLFDDDF
mmetsp:Transcript_89256/g.254785  ORF Transcript_89256/g.254785 Transcript_89256/m.254785 type:complete len:341 (-) Transcript_89256:81-1103(-)|eukprot:CAMPEP_0119514784 /NCGR_PEP_ID=MMETSP1344-20130328/32498_1 /TAXON_ID=236787 /ORGANISM="Florenciella parvula, Strain CCMP2471" /LENGTH=340 /DNA_ID=CAMNT_0007552127 /DNA_START=177 /DNA_END=1199 /DNA_ORIENTATION=+